MFNTVIETPRLILRPFTQADIQPSFEMEQNPDISKYTMDGGVKTLQQVSKLINRVINEDYVKYGFGRLAIEYKATGEFIGFSGLKYMLEMDEVDLGYRIRKDLWGKGIATEAATASLQFGFEELGLEKIIAFIIPENVKSKRVLEKLGFSYTQDFYEDGVLEHKYEIFNPNKL